MVWTACISLRCSRKFKYLWVSHQSKRFLRQQNKMQTFQNLLGQQNWPKYLRVHYSIGKSRTAFAQTIKPDSLIWFSAYWKATEILKQQLIARLHTDTFVLRKSNFKLGSVHKYVQGLLLPCNANNLDNTFFKISSRIKLFLLEAGHVSGYSP